MASHILTWGSYSVWLIFTVAFLYGWETLTSQAPPSLPAAPWGLVTAISVVRKISLAMLLLRGQDRHWPKGFIHCLLPSHKGSVDSLLSPELWALIPSMGQCPRASHFKVCQVGGGNCFNSSSGQKWWTCASISSDALVLFRIMRGRICFSFSLINSKNVRQTKFLGKSDSSQGRLPTFHVGFLCHRDTQISQQLT